MTASHGTNADEHPSLSLAWPSSTAAAATAFPHAHLTLFPWVLEFCKGFVECVVARHACHNTIEEV